MASKKNKPPKKADVAPQDPPPSPEAPSPDKSDLADREECPDQLARHHMRLGFNALALFAIAALFLGSLHAFKAGFYLDADQETRRLMWSLGHAVLALLALTHIAFALVVKSLPLPLPSRRLASRTLLSALILLPSGFFLGGLWTHNADPGLGILLTPLGTLCLLIATLTTARAIT